MRRQWSQAMNSGLSAVAPHGAGSGGTVKTTRPARSPRSVGQTLAAVSSSKVDAAQPEAYASRRPGVASQSSSSPGHTTSVVQVKRRPDRVRTDRSPGSTETTSSRRVVQPAGTTLSAGRERDDMVASPPPT